jgi:hypothetical protein
MIPRTFSPKGPRGILATEKPSKRDSLGSPHLDLQTSSNPGHVLVCGFDLEQIGSSVEWGYDFCLAGML